MNDSISSDDQADTPFGAGDLIVQVALGVGAMIAIELGVRRLHQTVSHGNAPDVEGAKEMRVGTHELSSKSGRGSGPRDRSTELGLKIPKRDDIGVLGLEINEGRSM